jgi:hypothetical protein
MDAEMTMRELLEERGFPVAALALVADIDDSTAWNIVRGKSQQPSRWPKGSASAIAACAAYSPPPGKPAKPPGPKR